MIDADASSAPRLSGRAEISKPRPPASSHRLRASLLFPLDIPAGTATLRSCAPEARRRWRGKLQTELRAWTIKDSIELYNVNGWGRDFFSINEAGNVEVTPAGPGSLPIDLKELVDDLRSRGLNLPILIRFSDILRTRVEQLCGAFQQAIAENDYKGSYRGVYPIKVNQQRHVVEELIEYGRPFNLGIEAGSKPELLVALALQENPEALILCNGYKDRAFIETALLAQKLGRRVIITMDRVGELDTILAACRELDIRPVIGVRARLTTKGAGKWVESHGRPLEVRPHHRRDRGHGRAAARRWGCSTACSSSTSTSARRSRTSAPSRTRCARRAASSSSCTAWAPTCATSTAAAASASTTTAARPTSTPRSTTRCRSTRPTSSARWPRPATREGVPHPDIVTESGRALVAHHSVLVFNVLGTNEILVGQIPESAGPGRAPGHPPALRDLRGRLAQELPGGVPRRPPDQGRGASPPSTWASST